MKPLIIDMTLPDWQTWVKANRWPAYRAAQIAEWTARGIWLPEAMTNLPNAIRQQLALDFETEGLRMEDRQVSAQDGTIKYSFLLADGNRIESVRMLYRHGQSVCISSQSGCQMGCTFCASTGAGFGRDLTAGEMLAQVMAIARDTSQRVSHVTIMGIGEPFANYDQLMLFLERVHAPDGPAISLRHISVSTCGLVPEMLKFTDTGLPVTLSISLHAPNDQIRRQLMPIARRYPMDELLAACRRHVNRTSRRISFEYALFAGINDREEHADELASRLRGMLCHVNLIPGNEFAGGRYQRSSQAVVRRFQQLLLNQGINATIRRELGTDIMAACGQLRRTKETCANT